MSDSKPGPDDGRVLTGGISYMGATGYGAFVQFVVGFEDGSTEPFRCRYENLPQLMQGLQNAGAITEQARAGLSRPSLDLATPDRVTNTRTGQSPEGIIAIQFSTERGIPVLLRCRRIRRPSYPHLCKRNYGSRHPNCLRPFAHSPSPN
jgi:hypothetical protein